MHYDQSWMGYGTLGGLEAGLIALVVGVLVFGVFHALGRRAGWHYGAQFGWSYLVTLLLAASGDLWDLVYFNYAQLQSLQLLKAKLAEVHDPDGIGTRVFFEFVGAGIGLYLGYLLFAALLRRRARGV
ncbi:hypothetical protein [Dyella sp.]|uniref:hypothetical protein n=1 Tax=Dyella sp. TaxID=1869338 RepID=UPI002ED49156